MTIEERISCAIAQHEGHIVLRTDVALLGSSSQVTRVLNALQAQGVLVRIGVGVYAKTRKSSVTGATVPAGSLETLSTEALKRLGVVVNASSAAVAYNSRQTTQLPGTFVVNTGKRRIKRKLTVGGRSLEYEND